MLLAREDGYIHIDDGLDEGRHIRDAIRHLFCRYMNMWHRGGNKAGSFDNKCDRVAREILYTARKANGKGISRDKASCFTISLEEVYLTSR
jgi:hypothetical protein